MLFNSLEFLLFLPLVLAAWALAPRRARVPVLALASYLFYAGWNPAYVPLLVFSTLLDYGVGRGLGRTEDPTARRLLLALSLSGNLGILFAFKYAPFVLAGLGIGPSPDALPDPAYHVYGYIPPGISFYTFQTLSYTFDVYRRRSEPCTRIADFTLFVAFFPQLVAGPIMRWDQFAPQLARQAERGGLTTSREWIQGVELFAVGMFKKVVLADNVALVCDRVFAAPHLFDGPSLALGGFLFLGQIYLDFSAYSTMARGLGRMVGFELPRNFDSPYLASNPVQYRRGWHITMSTWFRDYVFHPLGGTRVAPWRVSLNILIVWALFGLWHGPSWTFVFWGLWNGAYQAAYRELERRGVQLPAFPGRAFAGWLLMIFTMSLPSGTLFRAPSAAQGVDMLRRVYTVDLTGQSLPLWVWGALAGLLVWHKLNQLYYDENWLVRRSWPTRISALALITAAIVVLSPPSRPFIYFQF